MPRQNGKNAILEMRELFGMVVLGEKFLHTAHEVKTARKAFLRLASFFENERHHPELAALVQEVRRTNGQEAILLTNGGSVEFVARSKGSGRGYTVDVLVMDEAQELSEEALEALLPTISAAPSGNPQQIYTGTPPGPRANGEIFTRVRGDGLSGRDKRLAWDEWSCERGADLDDRSNLAATNPSLGLVHGLKADVAEAERGSMTDEGYGRERFGIWDADTTGGVIDMALWRSLADPASRRTGAVVFAADVTPDRAFSAIAVAGRRADGSAHVEVVEHRRGTGWLVAELVRLSQEHNAPVLLDGHGPIGSLVPELERAGARLVPVTLAEARASCGAFYDAVMAGSLRHIDQEPLNAALAGAVRREMGDGGWLWSRKNSDVDISPLVAVTLAQHGLITAPAADADLFFIDL